MLKILEIIPAQGKLYQVKLEGEQVLWLHADLILSEHLAVGQICSEADLERIRHAAAYHRAYEYALYCLAQRGYSYRALYRKLMGAKHAEEEAVLEALEKLVRLGFLNDAAYAQSLARNYIECKHYGMRRAAFEMRQKGLSQDDIDAALAPYEDADQIAEQLQILLEKRYARQLTDPDDRKAIDRVTASLVRRGFSFPEIRAAITAWFADYTAE